jgi:anti-sigma B factor antagonist
MGPSPEITPSPGWKAPPPFRARPRESGRAVIVEMRGELDLASAGKARAELELAAERGFDPVVADLKRVDMLDSTGLGVLIEAAKRELEEGGPAFAILCPGGLHARGALSVSGVLDRLRIFEDEEELTRFLADREPRSV